jgi:RNA polymerase sigma-70 factor (ECF subfamily)
MTRSPSNSNVETTAELLARIRAGDELAANALYTRCLPPLQRWARGRLPAYARDLLNTQDLVQETVIRSLRHLEHFESRHTGALQSYLREAILNRIRDEIRRHNRQPRRVELDPSQRDDRASPLELAIGKERLERYEAALAHLRPADREAIVDRIELQYGYAELALALRKPSPDAARVAVTRAIARLIEEMKHAR